MRATLPGIIALLVERQGADGGWGARAGLPSNSECTALCAAALGATDGDPAARARAVAWLLARQQPRGAWFYDDSGAAAPWPTPLVLLALLGESRAAAPVARGFEWLIEQRGRAFPWRQRLRDFLSGEQAVALDSTLDGWAWTEGTFAWVEPTSWALAACKARWPDRVPRRVRRRVDEAERMLADRACTGGGWNYGNSVVLGAGLEPFPDTTAIALIGLRGAPSEVVRSGFAALDGLLDAHASPLSLALALIASRAWRRDAGTLRTRLLERLETRAAEADHRTLSLAALGLTPDLGWLGVRDHA